VQFPRVAEERESDVHLCDETVSWHAAARRGGVRDMKLRMVQWNISTMCRQACAGSLCGISASCQCTSATYVLMSGAAPCEGSRDGEMGSSVPLRSVMVHWSEQPDRVLILVRVRVKLFSERL